MKAHPEDILIVGYAGEANLWPEFPANQIVSVNSVKGAVGLRFRTAYVTRLAFMSGKAEFYEQLWFCAFLCDGQVKDSDYFKKDRAAETAEGEEK